MFMQDYDVSDDVVDRSSSQKKNTKITLDQE